MKISCQVLSQSISLDLNFKNQLKYFYRLKSILPHITYTKLAESFSGNNDYLDYQDQDYREYNDFKPMASATSLKVREAENEFDVCQVIIYFCYFFINIIFDKIAEKYFSDHYFLNKTFSNEICQNRPRALAVLSQNL